MSEQKELTPAEFAELITEIRMARDTYESCQGDVQRAQRNVTNALNHLNNLQRQYDEAHAALTKHPLMRGSDWGRVPYSPAGPNETK